MKVSDLSLEEMLKFKGAIESGASAITLPINRDGKTVFVTAKSVTEYIVGYNTLMQNGEILIAENLYKAGIRSIQGNTLKPGVNQLVTHIRLLADITGSTAESDTNLLAMPFAGVAGPALKFAEFRITQNQELLRTTVSDIHNFKASTGNDADFKGIVPFVLRDQVPISVNIKASAAYTQYHAYRVEWRAIEFVVSPQA